MIIGISGYMGSGKDTIGDHLVRCHGFRKYAIAKHLKDIACNLFGLTKQQVYYGKDLYVQHIGKTVRQILQELGEHLRYIYPDVWIRAALEDIRKDGVTHAVICDCRYRNEIEMIESIGGITWRVHRDIPHNEALAHVSEQELAKHPFTINLDNNKTFDHLYQQVDTIMQQCTGGHNDTRT